LIPDFFTLGNLALGVLALFYVLEGRYEFSISLVFIAMVLDGIDGKLAAMLKVSSERGKQLDSLCDLVSFGVVPATIFYALSLHAYGTLGLLAAIMFPLAGAWRLARFNINSSSDKGDFMGLPITIAGGALVAILLHNFFLISWLPIPYIFFLSFLMMSRIPYPAVKKKHKTEKNLNYKFSKGKKLGKNIKATLSKSYSFVFFYLVVIVFTSLILLQQKWIFFFLSAYVAIGLIYGFYKVFKKWKKRKALLSLPYPTDP